MEHLTLERNSHDLVPLSRAARKNAKDIAFNKTTIIFHQK